MTRIAVIGGGKMGEALIAGIVADRNSPGGNEVELSVVEADAGRAVELAERYQITRADLPQVASDCEVLILAVKPNQLFELGQELASSLQQNQVVISVAAGASLEFLQRLFGDQPQLVRAMPNTPALVGKGVTGVSFSDSTTDQAQALAYQLFSSVGTVVTIPEQHQDALTSVSGSGPAYVFAFVEALAAGGIAQGLDCGTAAALARQTVIGAAGMLEHTDNSATELRENVTSPNGTTQSALESFAESGLDGTVARAELAAATRSAEMTEQLLAQLDQN